MNIIYLDPEYHAYLERIKTASQFLWMSARGTEDEPLLYSDAIQNVKKVLQYTLPTQPFVSDGLPMYEDDLERLQNVVELLNILVVEFPDDITGYRQTNNPETFMRIAVELWGEMETGENG